jgi:MFS family permease
MLRRNRPFRLLWTARAVSTAGDALSLVALMLFVADTTGQAIAVSALLLAGDFVPSLLGPITGVISDRFDRKRVMIVCELAQSVLLVLIALALPSLPLLLGLAAARAVAGQVFQPASRAAVPSLVDGRALERANSTLGFGTTASEVLGPLAAAALFPLVGVRGVLLVDAASFVASALLLVPLPALPPSDEHRELGLLGGARAGIGYLLATPTVRAITLGYFGIVACNGVDDVALVLLAKDTLHTGDSAVALLLSAVGIGLLAGYALLARFSLRASMAVLLLLGFAVSSAGNLLTGLAWAVSAAFTMQAVRGLGIAALDVASNTLLQRLVPGELLGRVYGTLYGAIGVAAAMSYVGGGLLLDATSAPMTLVVAGAGGLLATAATALALSRSKPDP